MRLPENLGFILLGIWLILMGLNQLLGGAAFDIVLGLLALAAGVILLFDRLNLRARRSRRR